MSEWLTKDPKSLGLFFFYVALEAHSHCRVLIKPENLFVLLLFLMPLNYFNVITTLSSSNLQRWGKMQKAGNLKVKIFSHEREHSDNFVIKEDAALNTSLKPPF